MLANERKGPPSHPEGPQEPDRKQPQERATTVPTPALEVKAAGGGEMSPSFKKNEMRCYGDLSPSLTRLPFIYIFYTSLGFKPLSPVLGCAHSESPGFNVHAMIV